MANLSDCSAANVFLGVWFALSLILNVFFLVDLYLRRRERDSGGTGSGQPNGALDRSYDALENLQAQQRARESMTGMEFARITRSRSAVRDESASIEGSIVFVSVNQAI